ncbi:tripartite tricarboxylate transporter substrate binding protein [Achromobacter xylosoxidans]|uniref:tripartite tricarboxylate transporter substrate binding protein n=1 Tax=Alcaligenes xylosoxydans xylosoxydans TaxID=85698 RepID=UPI001EEAEF66|nr:tripartite tricarboxylate transporter substrate binding protein [Achromobacter xylosoxidans]
MTYTTMRRALAAVYALAALGGGLAAAPARAEEKPLILVVPYPPGGSTDILARILQPRLSKELGGRAVVVENRPGAASQIATAFVARAESDGSTLLVSFDNHGINPAVKPKLPYDTFKDFVAITQTVRFPLVLGANPGVPGDNLKEFLAAAAKQPPNKFNYASTGVGSLNHLAPEELKRLSKVELLHVPYGGGGPAIQAVVGGQANMTWLSFAALRGQIQAGKIKPLAVAGEKRLPDLPNLPTVAESGFPGFVAYSWSGMFAPKGTPEATIKKLTQAFNTVLADADVKKKLEEAGFEIVASNGPALDAYVKAEYDRWSKFIKSSNINLDN